MIASKKYMVAVCDILGFGEYVKSTPAQTVVDSSLSFFHKTLCHSIYKISFPKEKPSLQELRKQSRLGLAWFSDTVLLYTRNDTNEDCKELINTVAWLLFENMFSPFTRIRAGISYGESYMDTVNEMYIGKAIVEAFEIEKNQAWAGGALTTAAEQRIPDHALKGSRFNWHLVRYPVPMKNDKKVQSSLAVDWTFGDHNGFDLRYSKNHNNIISEENDIFKKWENTVQFHSAICCWCRKTTNQNMEIVF